MLCRGPEGCGGPSPGVQIGWISHWVVSVVTMAFALLSRLYWLLLMILHFFYFPLQLISSKVPKAEYVPTIIRRDDPSIIPILYVSVTPPLRLHVWEQA